MVDSPESADQDTEPVGAILARWRRKKRLTGQALGERVGLSQSTISRLETGVVSAESDDVRQLGEVLGVPRAEVDRVVALVERSDNRLTEWTSAKPRLADRQNDTAEIEAQAKVLRIFQPAVVPGLAQTSEYARALFFALKDELDDARIADSPIAVSEAVNARMRRSQVLLLPDHTFHLLITEQVLRNRVCDPAAMIAQIARLRDVAAYPNVQLRIVRDDVELPIAPYHGFFVADDRWVSVDLFNSSLRSRGNKVVQSYRRVFDALEGAAVADIGDLLSRYQSHYARMLLQNSALG